MFYGGGCYGIESKFGFVAHGNPFVPEINGISIFPIRLVEAAANLMIFSVLLWLYKKEIRGEKLIFLYLALYCPCRFFLEFFRGDVYRGILFGISTSQWISIIIMLTLIALSLTKTEKKEPIMW